MNKEQGEFVKHLSCDECGSNDNKALYMNADSYSTYCFGCEHSEQGLDADGDKLEEGSTIIKEEASMEFKTEAKVDLSVINKLPSKGLAERKIYGNVARYYGLKVAMMGEGTEITHHMYPFTKGNKVVGYQKRDVANKTFSAVGYGKSDIQLQGQHLWPNGGGKHLVITEGFLDMLSVSQVLSGIDNIDIRYPVVSLPSGANTKCIVNNLEWISSFNRVVIMTDQDEAGRSVAKEIAKMLPPGKAHIAKFSEKDASDMLVQGKEKELQSSFWQAPMYSPSGIVTGADAIEILEKKKNEKSYPYPDFCVELNERLLGKRLGEIVTVISGTGSGKTSFVKEDIYHTLMTTDLKVGICSLEESPADVMLNLLSLHVDKRLHIASAQDNFGLEEKVKDQAIKELFLEKADRLVILDHAGSTQGEELIEKIRFMIATGCNYIVLDTVTLAIATRDNINSAMSALMSDILKLAKRHKVFFMLVSHLRKTGQGGKAYEEGGIPNIDDAIGGSALKQVSFDIISMTRNRMAEDEEEARTTELRVLKSRYTGFSGRAGKCMYSERTGKMSFVEKTIEEDTRTKEFTVQDKPITDDDFKPKEV